MPLRIEKIAVKNCGPLNNLNLELSDVNLIYSENERGKSFLVEFIIHNLFKDKNYWKDLRQPGQGKVLISGIESKMIEFSPSTRKKLDDYLEKQHKGLPPHLCNLLIVKEGETKIIKNNNGVNKNIFKDILSPRKILYEIDNDRNISATIKKAKIYSGEINIEKRGEGKDYIELKEKVNKIEELIRQIINEYEQGEIKDLQIKKEELIEAKNLLVKAKKYQAYLLYEELKSLRTKKEKISEIKIEKLKTLIDEYIKQNENLKRLDIDIDTLKKQTQEIPERINKREMFLKAKRHEAYKISVQIKKIEERLRKFSEEDIFQIQKSITQYDDKSSEREEKIKTCNILKEKSKDYQWLKAARDNYNRFLSSGLSERSKISFMPYLSGILLIAGILLMFLEQKISTIVLILMSAFSVFYYVLKLKSSFINLKQGEELKDIKKEFFNRFAVELESLAKLEEKLKEQEKNYYNLETYEKEIERLTADLKSIKRNIEESFARIGFHEIEENRWLEKYTEIKNQRKILLDEYQKLKGKLEELEVEEQDYEINDPGVKFSKNEMSKIMEEIVGLERLKKQEESKEKEKLQLENDLSETKRKINETFKDILGFQLKETEWMAKSEELEREKNLIEQQTRKIEGLLEGLSVSEEEFERENPQKTFSQQELEKIERELALVEERIKEKNEEFSNLRNRIIQLTGIDFSANWNEMIEKVYLKRKELYDALEDLEAKIIAGIIVHETIQELQQEEDEKLLEKINSPEIKNLIQRLTGRYKTLSFDEKDIIISDDYFNFKINDLSTGAKEQLMIALRIGFAKSLLKGETAFLILDDAFQHSDYKKRPMLIDTLFDLAKDNWQIIYLTMDDHIRNLFREKSESMTVKFKEVCLSNGE